MQYRQRNLLLGIIMAGIQTPIQTFSHFLKSSFLLLININFKLIDNNNEDLRKCENFWIGGYGCHR